MGSRSTALLCAIVALATLTLAAVSVPASAVPTSAVPTSAVSPIVDGSSIIRPEEGEIFRLYRSVLAREPETDGFAYWVSLRMEGVPLSTVAAVFLDSDEYRLRFGSGPNAEFVDRTYRNVLGRSGEPAGSTYWLEQLSAGLARTELVLLFSESLEHGNRTGTTLAELPPFRPVVATVSEAEVSQSWRPGCPVGPASLRSIELDHVDFDGVHARGALVVHAAVVDDVISIFSQLYAARYPIAAMAPIDAFAGDDDASMEGNNTSAFNCRPITAGRSWSRHAYGTAIDVNPVQNPYVALGVTLPPAGATFVDRSTYHPAMIRPGDVVTSAFERLGWRWGGDFQTLKDYQHFEL